MATKRKATAKARTARARKSSKTSRKPARRTAAAAPRIPYHTVTPYLAIGDASAAIDWYKKAFGARELSRMPGPAGKLMHAEIMIGDSRVMLSDVFPGGDTKEPRELGGNSTYLHIIQRNIDRLWQRAVAAGARVTMPLENQFWGDRYGKLQDPFGHSWGLSYKAKMSKQEMEQKQREAMSAFSAGAHG
jgi:PhnB protein